VDSWVKISIFHGRIVTEVFGTNWLPPFRHKYLFIEDHNLYEQAKRKEISGGKCPPVSTINDFS
jgi:hypothetical protein